MSPEHVVNLLQISNEYLPLLEHRYKRLKKEINSLEIELSCVEKSPWSSRIAVSVTCSFCWEYDIIGELLRNTTTRSPKARICLALYEELFKQIRLIEAVIY